MHEMTGPMWMPSLPPNFDRLFSINIQPVPVMLYGCLILGGLYLWGVARLHKRQVDWNFGRTLNFLLGLLLIIAVSETGIGGYSMTLFSVHMAQHMVLNMLAPLFLLLGAPVTLALRALPSRSATRRRLLRVLHSRFVAVISHPGFTIPVFLISLYGLYFTSILDWAMGNAWTHYLMMIHFVAIGALFFWPIMGIDPGPGKHSYPVRIGELFLIMPFHAFFGISLMMSSRVISTSFKGPQMWGMNAINDQYTGGAIAWAFAELPSLIVLLAVVFAWTRSEERAAKRYDRQADRDNGAELDAYNARLRALAARQP